MKSKRRLVIITAILTVLLLSLALTYQSLLTGLGEFLVMQDEPRNADTIILSYNATHERLQHSVDLYKQGYAKKLIISNFKIDLAGVATSNSGELAVDEAVALGVSPDDIILILDKPTSTYQEAQYLRKIMFDRGFYSALVVTAPHRMRRTALTYKNVFGDDMAVIASPADEEQVFEPDSWWKSREGISALYNEYPRLVFYFIQGRFR